METEASIGYGSFFHVSQDNGATWIEIAEVFDITPPSDTVDVVDATHMQSPDRTREFITGLSDPGEASFEMNFVPGSASDAKIREIRSAGSRVKCRITFPNAVAWTFSGLVTGYEPAVPTDDKMTATVTFKVTGSYVSAPAAAPTNTVLPAISGVAQVGQVLTAYPGVWTAAPAFTYQWKKDGVDIGGETDQTYTPVVGDVGSAITVAVTGTNSAGSATATSAATPDVIAA
jgi:predicted secreted protein